MRGQRTVAAWSEFAFTQLSVDGQVLPVVGIQRRVGTVEPPTISGQPLRGPDQIELGTETLAELGKKVGDTVRIGVRPFTRTVRITAQRARLVHTIVAANPDRTPGGTYELRSALAAAIVNARQMGGQPIALALGLALAAVASLALTVLSSLRRRRHELALLKALGMTRGQLRSVIAWPTTLTLLIAVAIGGPLGVAAGRLAWQGFAGSLGAMPVSEIPVAWLILGLLALVLAGNLVSTGPAAIDARTRPAIALRAE